jgi:hypothetical protein
VSQLQKFISGGFAEAEVLKNCTLIPQTGRRETLRTFAITSSEKTKPSTTSIDSSPC